MAVGKTTVAKRLSRLLCADYISIDEVMTAYHLDTDDSNIPVRNFLAANEAIVPRIQASLKEYMPTILDGHFYFHEQIAHIRNALDDVKIITLSAKIEDCLQRDQQKDNPCGQKAVKEVYEKLGGFTSGQIIDTGDLTIPRVIEEVLKKLFPNKLKCEI